MVPGYAAGQVGGGVAALDKGAIVTFIPLFLFRGSSMLSASGETFGTYSGV